VFDPHPDHAMEAEFRIVRDVLARQKYPGSYDAEHGIVIDGPGHDRLRPGVADITPERSGACFIRFFAERTPGHVRGDELVYLAPLTRANFTPAAYRVIGIGSNVPGAV